MSAPERDDKRNFPEAPDELRMDIALTRQELGNTVEALIRKADIPTRARQQWQDRTQPVRDSVSTAATTVREVAPEPLARQTHGAADAVRGTPVTAALAALAAVMVFRAFRRTRPRE